MILHVHVRGTYDDTHSCTSDNGSSQSLQQQGLQVNSEGGGTHKSVQQKLHQLRVPEEGSGLVHSLGGRRLGQQQYPVMQVVVSGEREEGGRGVRIGAHEC